METIPLNIIIVGIGLTFGLLLPLFYNYYVYTDDYIKEPLKIFYTYLMFLITSYYIPFFIIILLMYCFFECIKLGINIEKNNKSKEEDIDNLYDIVIGYDFVYKNTPKKIYIIFWILLLIGIIASLPESILMIILSTIFLLIFIIVLGLF